MTCARLSRLLPGLAVLLGALGLFNAAPSAAATLVGNMGQPTNGDIGIPEFAGRGAQRFTTGAQPYGYILTSVSLGISAAVGTPANLRVELWSKNNTLDIPGTKITSLMVPSSVGIGVVDFAAPANTALNASTSYFVVIYRSGATTGKYVFTSSTSEDAGGESGWSIRDERLWLLGITWKKTNNPVKIRVNGSVVPPRPPAMPRNVQVTPGDEKLTLTWQTPSSWGTWPAAGYDIHHFSQNVVSWSVVSSDRFDDTDPTLTSFIFEGLHRNSPVQNGKEAGLRIRAASQQPGTDGSQESHFRYSAWVEVSSTPGVPQAISAVTVTPGFGKLDLSWTAPTSGVSAITGYDVHYTSAASGTVADGADASGSDPATAWVAVSRSGTMASQTIPNLIFGTTYRVRMRAVNTHGAAAWAFGTGTLPALAAPTDLHVSEDDGFLALWWKGSFGVPAYEVHYTSAAVGTVADDADASGSDASTAWVGTGDPWEGVRASIPDLTNGTRYRVRVRALKGSSTSAWLFGAGTPEPYRPPGNLKVIPTADALTLTWTAASGFVYHYEVHYTSAPATGTGAVTNDAAEVETGDPAVQWVVSSYNVASGLTPYTIPNLVPGTEYRVRVRAVRADDGAWVFGAGTPPQMDRPSVPQSVQVTAGDGKLTLSWQAPANWGGGLAASRRYFLMWKHKGQSRWGQVVGPGTLLDHASAVASDATSFEFTGSQFDHEGQSYTVTNGVPYDLRILAGTSDGDSGWVTVIGTVPQGANTVSVAVAPSAPTDLQVEAGSGSLALSWVAPSQGVVTGYDLTYKEQAAPNRRARTDYLGRADPGAGWVHRFAAAGDVAHTIPNLDNGTPYDVRIRARSIAGPGPWESGTGTPRITAPAFSPAGGETTMDAGTNITLTFAAAISKDSANTAFTGHADLSAILTLKRTDGSGGTDIGYTASIDGAGQVITIDPASDLADGAVYVAISTDYYDADGNRGTAASATFTVGQPPTDTPGIPGTDTPGSAAPTDLNVTPGTGKLDLTWTAPPGTVTGYEVHYTASQLVADDAAVGTTVATQWVDAGHTGTAALQTISGLSNGTVYRLRVRAVSAGGDSDWLHGTGTVLSPTVTLTATPNPVEEGSPVTLTATLSTAEDDDFDDETLTVALGVLPSAVGAGRPARVTITITDDDLTRLSVEDWLARFARTASGQVLEAVRARLSGGHAAGLQARLGGQDLSGLSLRPAALEQLTPALVSLHGASAQELLAGTSFSLGGQTSGGTPVALWGRGAHTQFDGRAGGASLDGEVDSVLLGADWAFAQWRTGLALGHTRADGEAGAGRIKADLTGVYPYAGRNLGEGRSLWAVGGWGRGEVELRPEDAPTLKADIDLLMGAAGLRSALLRGEGRRLDLATQARFARVTSDSVREGAVRLSSSQADTWQLRAGLEGKRHLELDTPGMTLVPSFTLAARLDGGDAEDGLGADLGAGLELIGRAGLTLELNAHALLVHADSDYEEWGASAALNFDPKPSSAHGPALSLHQVWGTASGTGMAAQFAHEALAGDPVRAGGDVQMRLEGELGYGLAAFDGWTAVPHVGFALDGGTLREVRLGTRWQPPGTPALEVRLEAAHRPASRESTGLVLSGALRW